MKRICHITTAHHVADPRIYDKECRSLRHAGYDVTLIGPDHDGSDLEGVNVVDLRVPARNRLERMARRPPAAYRAALEVDADLYHFHDPEFLPYGVRLALAGRRVVYDAHEDAATQAEHKEWIPRPLRTPTARAVAELEALCIGRLDGVVAVNDQILARLRRHQPRGVVVANYPRLGDIVPAPAWSERERAAGYVGGITRVRGAHDMVKAMSEVDGTLYLAGPVSPPSLLEDLKSNAGWNRVRYLGYVDRVGVADLLARVKVGLMPLHPTPQYRGALLVKLFEYMAAGIPVVATDLPHWRRVLEDNDCGFCVPPESPKLLADAISTLLDDDERARAMGEGGRRAAEERYSWDTQADALVSLYEEILS